MKWRFLFAILFLSACIPLTPTPAPGITVTPAGGVTVPAPITPSGCTVGDQIPYVYHDYRLVVQATCIVVIGRVEAVRGEADGDRHVMVRLNSQYQQYINTGNTAHQSGDLVVEPVCFSVPTQADAIDPCRIDPDPIRTLPNVGDCAQFEGRYVLDTTHFSWAEIHPLGKWTPSNACSAALRSLEQLHFEDPQDD